MVRFTHSPLSPPRGFSGGKKICPLTLGLENVPLKTALVQNFPLTALKGLIGTELLMYLSGLTPFFMFQDFFISFTHYWHVPKFLRVILLFSLKSISKTCNECIKLIDLPKSKDIDSFVGKIIPFPHIHVKIWIHFEEFHLPKRPYVGNRSSENQDAICFGKNLRASI